MGNAQPYVCMFLIYKVVALYGACDGERVNLRYSSMIKVSKNEYLGNVTCLV